MPLATSDAAADNEQHRGSDFHSLDSYEAIQKMDCKSEVKTRNTFHSDESFSSTRGHLPSQQGWH